MKVMIVIPKLNQVPGEHYLFPLGPAYIASALTRAGHSVIGCNPSHFTEDPGTLVEKEVRYHDPDVVMCGSLMPYLPNMRDVFAAARRAKPDIINVAGGGALSGDPEAGPVLLDIDAGVIGEGEETAVDLCDALDSGRDLGTVNGIVFKRKDGQILRTAPRPAIRDLGSIAWPDYELFGAAENLEWQRTTDAHFYHATNNSRSIPMISSRSCPYHCTFCFHPTGKIYRERPLDDFFAEVDQLIARYKINGIMLIDELFSLKRSRLLEFCERIEPYNLRWLVQLHTNSADPEILRALKRSGCAYISYGIESMSQPVLISMEKGSKKDRIDRVLNQTKEAKIGIQGNIIFGDTNETLETANESLAWWAKNREHMINLHVLQVYPGSPDYIEAVKDGLITDRIAFINNLNQAIYINISKLNQIDCTVLRAKVDAAQQSLYRFAKASVFERESDVDPLRGQLYHVIWDCPRCESTNDYHSVVMNVELCNEQVLRLTCRDCFARFDIPNEIRVRFENRPQKDEFDRFLKGIQPLIPEGMSQKAIELLRSLVYAAPWYWPAQVELAQLYNSSGSPAHAIIHLAEAVRRNPYEPRCHAAYACQLMEEGSLGFARLYFEQALILDPGNPEYESVLREMNEGPWEDKARETYFISYADIPAPKRLRGPAPPFRPRRRGQDEFPDIAQIEAEMRQMLAPAG